MSPENGNLDALFLPIVTMMLGEDSLQEGDM